MKSRCRRTLGVSLFGALAFFSSRLVALAAPGEIAGIEKVYFRSGPGADQPPIGVLNQGDRVDIIDVEGAWTKIETADGKVGFVYHRYVVPTLEGGSTFPPVPLATAAPLRPPPPPPAVAAAPPAPIAAAPPPPPAASAPAAAPTTDQLSTELAGLRAEVSELKQKVQEHSDGSETQAGGAGIVQPAYAPTSADSPNGIGQSASAREQGVGVLAVAFLSLIVGWVLGSAFSRRRSQSRRRRIRF
jgi:Bacterial SH3 domain